MVAPRAEEPSGDPEYAPNERDRCGMQAAQLHERKHGVGYVGRMDPGGVAPENECSLDEGDATEEILGYVVPNHVHRQPGIAPGYSTFMSHHGGHPQSLEDVVHLGISERDARSWLCLLSFPRQWWLLRSRKAPESEESICEQKWYLDYRSVKRIGG